MISFTYETAVKIFFYLVRKHTNVQLCILKSDTLYIYTYTRMPAYIHSYVQCIHRTTYQVRKSYFETINTFLSYRSALRLISIQIHLILIKLRSRTLTLLSIDFQFDLDLHK